MVEDCVREQAHTECGLCAVIGMSVRYRLLGHSASSEVIREIRYLLQHIVLDVGAGQWCGTHNRIVERSKT